MTINAAQGSRLALTTPGDTSNHDVFTAALPTELTRLLVCNVSALAATFRFFHVPFGGSSGSTNALFWDVSIATGATFDFAAGTDNAGPQLAVGDILAVRSGTANALTFNIYGVTASIAPGAR